MFTEEEKQLLQKYVTSTEEDVYAVTGMAGMVGAAYARYSRAKGGFRETLLKEFIKEGVIDPKHADTLIERILIAYGDDSVGELEGAHISFEKISILATKEIEDRRIGGSPIEQSTRYVLYDQKDAQGQWLYYRGDEIINSPVGAQYTETLDYIFQTYADLIEPLKSHLEKAKPLAEAEYDINGDGVKERLAELTDEKLRKSFQQTYNFDLRAKACDILRSLLPLATLTNVGMFANGRFYQNLISHLWTTTLPEARTIGHKTKAALDQIIPQYVRRAKNNVYLTAVHANMFALAHRLFGKDHVVKPAEAPEYILLDRGESTVRYSMESGQSLEQGIQLAADVATIAAMLYPYTDLPLVLIRKKVREMSEQERATVVAAYLGERVTRRDRPGRALESGYPYTFDMVTDFGVYKDLQRHRMSSQQRQLFTTTLGFNMPLELIDIGAEGQVLVCLDKANALYKAMALGSPTLAQYAVLHGHYIRWSIEMNDREAMHFTELRSTPQGHPGYRHAAQQIHNLISARSGWRGKAMKFVDHADYYWSRADSEAKQRVKEAKLDDRINRAKG